MGRTRASARARTESALCRGRIAVRQGPWAGPGGSRGRSLGCEDRPAPQPHQGCGSASTCLRTAAPPLGATLLGLWLGGAACPHLFLSPALLRSKPPSGRPWSLPFHSPSTSQTTPRPRRRFPGPPAAPARDCLGVVLKHFCQETPAGGRGAVRSAVSTAARGGQRAFTQPSSPPLPVPPKRLEENLILDEKINACPSFASAFGNGSLSPEQKAAGCGLELQTWFFFCLTLKHRFSPLS